MWLAVCIGPMSSVALFAVIRAVPLWWILAYLVAYCALALSAEWLSQRKVEARRDKEQHVDAEN